MQATSLLCQFLLKTVAAQNWYARIFLKAGIGEGLKAHVESGAAVGANQAHVLAGGAESDVLEPI